MHGGPGATDCLENYLGFLRFGYKETPAPAHRLDQDTSGCLILGRNQRALRKLGRLFTQGHIGKTYWAVVAGRPPADSGIIDQPIKKISSPQKGWRMVPAKDGQKARTSYRLRGSSPDGLSWLELTPHNGRTHQVRVHCALLGCPILGDPQYGKGDGQRLHLLARQVEIPLYEDRPPIIVQAAAPPHMRPALDRMG